ncbi:MAG: ADP-ribosylation factor-like protein [Candidatus Hermodarchaeota archaeon]
MRLSESVQPAIPVPSRQPYRIAFVGLDRSGKTVTLKRLSRGVLVNTKPTTGFSTDIFTFLGVQFCVLDLGNFRTFQIFWEKFLPKQQAVVFFIDSADISRLPETSIALNRTLEWVDPDTPVMILANKQDLDGALSLITLTQALNLTLVSKIRHLRFFSFSAKTGLGIYEAFNWITKVLEKSISPQNCNFCPFCGIFPLLRGWEGEKRQELVFCVQCGNRVQ